MCKCTDCISDIEIWLCTGAIPVWQTGLDVRIFYSTSKNRKGNQYIHFGGSAAFHDECGLQCTRFFWLWMIKYRLFRAWGFLKVQQRRILMLAAIVRRIYGLFLQGRSPYSNDKYRRVVWRCGAGVKVMYRTNPGEFFLLPQSSSRFSNRKVSSSSISFSISLRLRSECSSSTWWQSSDRSDDSSASIFPHSVFL